jgi:hypothetical protein
MPVQLKCRHARSSLIWLGLIGSTFAPVAESPANPLLLQPLNSVESQPKNPALKQEKSLDDLKRSQPANGSNGTGTEKWGAGSPYNKTPHCQMLGKSISCN